MAAGLPAESNLISPESEKPLQMNEFQKIKRRTAIAHLSAIAATALPVWQSVAAAEPRQSTGLGLIIYDCNIRRKWMRAQKPAFDLFEPLTFLKHCQSLGTGGMQANLGGLKADEIRKLRDFAEQHNLFIDAIVSLPKDKADLSRFEIDIAVARDVGVQAARTTMIPGRRYEQFQTLEEFREYEQRGRAMLELAAPIVLKHRVALAVENHKDQRLDERVALFKHLNCEFIGACVDTGYSFALLDGVYEPIEALAPYAMTVHLKDQALSEYEDGFLLGDIPLGQGSFDLQRMVETIRKAKPKVRFALELITRDPLKVPCLSDQYFATMPTSRATDLARTMRYVRKHTAKHQQQVSNLTLEEQVQLEDANVAASIEYARNHLKL